MNDDDGNYVHIVPDIYEYYERRASMEETTTTARINRILRIEMRREERSKGKLRVVPVEKKANRPSHPKSIVKGVRVHDQTSEEDAEVLRLARNIHNLRLKYPSAFDILNAGSESKRGE
ncbi:MAG TPA: hypothetical protein VJ841_03500 [Candidatus Saccharimonadales bacterium]|nr:hypothetical protein [Candidatus Saccharimonadales bacterium]